jgi:ketosteroid isomerase-like protein
MWKSISCSILIILSVTVLWAVQPNPTPVRDQDAIKQAVLKANAAMTRAANALDADAFFSYILDTDQCSIIQDGLLFPSRARALEVVKAGFERVEKMERLFDQPRVTVLSADTALLTASGRSAVSLPGGQQFDSPFAVSLVYVLRDGQWKLLHGHYSSPNPR